MATIPEAARKGQTPRRDEHQPIDSWSFGNINFDEIRELLNFIPPDICYDDWLSCLMGVHNETRGGLDGFNLVDSWSSAGLNYEGTEALFEKWKGFSVGGGYTLGTVASLARQNGADLSANANRSGGVSKSDVGKIKNFRGVKNRSAAGKCGGIGEYDPTNIASKQSTISATPFQWIDPSKLPKRKWLYGNNLIRKYLSVSVAPGGVGKSSEAIVQNLAMVTGMELLGTWVAGQLRCWLWNLEDPMDEIQRRLQAACQHYDLLPENIDDRLFVDSGRDQELRIAATTKSGAEICVPVVENVLAELKRNRIDVLTIDPFVSSHAVSENDNNAIDLVAKQWAKIADEANCSIHLIHHTRKAGPDAEVNAESSRGAKALVDAARDVRVFNRMTAGEGNRAGVQNHRLYFRTFSDKANLCPPAEVSSWFKIENIDLANGDSVGVVIPWSWPDAFDGITAADLEKARTVVANRKYRANAQSPDWAGHAIGAAFQIDTGFGLKISEMSKTQKAGNAKIKCLLREWIAKGEFRVVSGADIRRKPTTFLELGHSEVFEI